MIEAVGRAVSIETETIIAIWILPRNPCDCDDFISHLTKISKNLNMVKCQSQNTCKDFLSLQNGLSVWFTRLHNHGEDC